MCVTGTYKEHSTLFANIVSSKLVIADIEGPFGALLHGATHSRRGGPHNLSKN